MMTTSSSSDAEKTTDASARISNGMNVETEENTPLPSHIVQRSRFENLKDDVYYLFLFMRKPCIKVKDEMTLCDGCKWETCDHGRINWPDGTFKLDGSK